MIWDPDRGARGGGPSTIHAIPALFVAASQTASTEHESGVRNLTSRWRSILEVDVARFVDFSTDWAWSHSLADANPFVAISIGRFVLFSKMSLFLALQVAQYTQERMLILIPIGGRHKFFLSRTSALWKSRFSAMWTDCLRGMCCHTCVLLVDLLYKLFIS